PPRTPSRAPPPSPRSGRRSGRAASPVQIDFTGPVIEWRGPAPYLFVAVPEDEAALIESVSAGITYGWGMIPVDVTIGGTTWYTALWPRKGTYVVPLKTDICRAERIDLDDVVTVGLFLDV